MTRQSITLTPPNDAWLIAQVEERKEYGSKSDVVNDLIRKARAEDEKIRAIRAILIEAEQSGFIENPDPEELLAQIKSKVRRDQPV
jgi:antitoxin ParD1/3/4